MDPQLAMDPLEKTGKKGGGTLETEKREGKKKKRK